MGSRQSSFRPTEFGVTAVQWDAKSDEVTGFRVHTLSDAEHGGVFRLSYGVHCSAESLADAIVGGAQVWTMERRASGQYRRRAPVFCCDGDRVYTVPHELLLELPSY